MDLDFLQKREPSAFNHEVSHLKTVLICWMRIYKKQLLRCSLKARGSLWEDECHAISY